MKETTSPSSIFKIIFLLCVQMIIVTSVQAANLKVEHFYITDKVSISDEATIRDIFSYANNNRSDFGVKLASEKIKSNPKNPTFYIFRGYSYMKENNFDLAIKDFTSAIVADPNCSIMAYYLRAICNFNKEDYRRGFMDLHTAMDMLPTIPSTNPYIPPEEKKYKEHYRTSDNYNYVKYLINRAYADYAKELIERVYVTLKVNPNFQYDSDYLWKLYDEISEASEVMYECCCNMHDSEMGQDMDYRVQLMDLRNLLNQFAKRTEDKYSSGNPSFDAYMKILGKKISENWVPDEYQHKKAVVGFTILKNGEVRNIRIISSSGDEDVDIHVMNAVKMAAPFRPLEDREYLDINYTFPAYRN